MTIETERFVTRQESAPTQLTIPGHLRHELTGLPNREALDMMVGEAIEIMPGDFALIEVDLDGLKAVNDTEGHVEGDRYLQTAADIMTHSVRDDDIVVVHRSGDEFNIVLPHVSKQHEVEVVIARLQHVLDDEYGIGASMGGKVHETGEPAHELFKAADLLARTNKAARKLGCLTGQQKQAALLIEKITTQYDLTLRDLPLVIAALKRMSDSAG